MKKKAKKAATNAKAKAKNVKAKAKKKAPQKPARKGKSKAKASPKAPNIISMIEEHHKPLKRLIRTMKSENAELADKKAAFEEFAPLLLAHAKPEERALYEAMKERDWDMRVSGFEGDTEHNVADRLVEEIKDTTDDAQWEARVKVLAEAVEHHIEEEEEEMLPEVRKEFDEEELISMGQHYQALYDGDMGQEEIVQPLAA